MLQIESGATAGLIVVGGPTGCGKTSIINCLLAQHPDRFVRVPSFTTRSKRSDEAGEYTFVDREAMLQMHARGEFLNLDSVYGNLYGMSLRGIEAIVGSGRLAIKEVHPRNHSVLRDRYPQLVSILLPQVENATYDDPDGWEPERRARLEEDIPYYRNIDHQPFEIVRSISPNETPAEVAAHLYITISAVLKARSRFPSPGEIDAVNASGYSLAAKEFLDENRVTTAAFHQLSTAFFRDSINRFTGSGIQCLELGPGSGWLRGSFAWPSLNYAGVELSPAMLAEHTTPDRHRVHAASVRAMPFPSSYFDVVFASLADPFSHPAAWCEIWRVMRPGAKFIFSAPAAEWATALRETEKQDRTTFVLKDGSAAEVYSFTFSEPELRTALHSCGFDVVEFHTVFGALQPGNLVPPAFLKAASRAGIPHEAMKVVNCVVAQKSEKLSHDYTDL